MHAATRKLTAFRK